MDYDRPIPPAESRRMHASCLLLSQPSPVFGTTCKNPQPLPKQQRAQPTFSAVSSQIWHDALVACKKIKFRMNRARSFQYRVKFNDS